MGGSKRQLVQRLKKRDEEDWPVLATALALECPIWTEDADFFGAGVATWTTDRVELLLSRSFQKFGNVFLPDRTVTVAAPIQATSVGECRLDTRPYLWNGVLRDAARITSHWKG